MLQDLYVFLIVVFLIERFPGSDLMHDVFRKTVGSQGSYHPSWLEACLSDKYFYWLPVAAQFHVQVIAATIAVVIWKLFGGMLFETSSVGGQSPSESVPLGLRATLTLRPSGARVGGPLRQKKTEGLRPQYACRV